MRKLLLVCAAIVLGLAIPASVTTTAKADDVEVQCQMGSSCIYQKVLSRSVVKSRDGGTTVINARIRSCFKDLGPPNEKTGRYPVPSHYSCQLSDDLNTDYVVASCNRGAPFVGGYVSREPNMWCPT